MSAETLTELLAPHSKLILLAFLCLFGLLVYFSWWQQRKGETPLFRDIPAFRALQMAVSDAVEAGRTVHLAMGLGGISSDTTADSLASVEVLDYLAAESATKGLAPIVTMADATLLPVAQDALRRQYRLKRDGLVEPLPDVRWLSPEPSAYAAGVMGLSGAEQIQASVMAGVFGDEYLLLAEAADRHSESQIGAVSDPTVLPFVYATADNMLMGEEMYAAGAYLTHKPWHMASLKAQDWVRWIVVAGIFAAVVVTTFV